MAPLFTSSQFHLPFSIVPRLNSFSERPFVSRSHTFSHLYSTPSINQVLKEVPRRCLPALSSPRNRRSCRRPRRLCLHGHARLGLQDAPPRLPGQRRVRFIRSDQLREEFFLAQNPLRGRRASLRLTPQTRTDLRRDLRTLENRGEVGNSLEFLRGNGEPGVPCPRADRR